MWRAALAVRRSTGGLAPVAGEILKRRLAITLPALALTSEPSAINRVSLLSTPHSLLLVSTFLPPSFTVRLWGAPTSWRVYYSNVQQCAAQTMMRRIIQTRSFPEFPILRV